MSVSSHGAGDPLEAGFANPPASAHPQTWWHWMNGNVTREGITADLEAMHRIGIQEANIITVASDIPPGPVPVMSPAFFDMVRHAAREADRLGMTLCMDNCPGWSSSGGPWVSPEHAMQMVVFSQLKVTGPVKYSASLPQPTIKNDFYRDIAVLAFKTPAGDVDSPIAAASPKITSSTTDLDGSLLMDSKAKTYVTLPSPTKNKPQVVQIEFEKPYTARSLILTPGPKCPRCSGQIDWSEDGVHFGAAQSITISGKSTNPITVSLGADLVTARIFRLHFISSASKDGSPITLSEINFTSRLTISNLARKAVYNGGESDPVESAHQALMTAPAEQMVHRDSMVNISTSMKPDGSLSWDVPPGDWTIVRFGYTPTGVTNHPAPPEATGLECDKLSKAGLDASWNGMMQPLLDKLGPDSKVLVDCLIDSYETGGQNWTPGMVAEFSRRRGYDPTPFLPVLTGRVVDSEEVTERFLWDWRRTIADLFAENYFGYFAELCHKHGMKSLVEPYWGPFEGLQSGSTADVPMGEFWSGGLWYTSLKLASSVGHIYGQPVIGAESFTGIPEHGRWTDDPYSLKSTGDMAFTQGINRFIFHRYAHQPWMNRFPGMTMGQWGINLDRTNTWFEKAKPWMDYISRSQFLLQQGRFVADVAHFSGESTPGFTRTAAVAVPRGYDYDGVNAEVLLKSSVKDHRLVLPDGMNYALLVLPAKDPLMTPAVLRKVRDLVAGGLTVMGDKPTRSPSLQDYPNCDQQVNETAAELWADCDGTKVTEHTLGQGKIVSGKTIGDVFDEMKLPTDFDDPTGQCIYLHREIDGSDEYFVSNQLNKYATVNCTFRVSGKVPELWHPDTGVIETAPVYEEKDGRTAVRLQLDPVGSVFVVFRHSAAGVSHVVEVLDASKPAADGDVNSVGTAPAFDLRTAGDGSVELLQHAAGAVRLKNDAGKILQFADSAGVQTPVSGGWNLAFPPNWGAPASIHLDQLISWTQHSDPGVKYFSGTATYVKRVTISRNASSIVLDLGRVKNIAQVSVNGKDLGILWKPPFRVDITDAVVDGPNTIQVQVTDLWPNRIIGDAELPEDTKWSGMRPEGWPKWVLDGKPSPTGRFTFYTWRHWTRGAPLLESGLIGPVVIESGNWAHAK